MNLPTIGSDWSRKAIGPSWEGEGNEMEMEVSVWRVKVVSIDLHRLGPTTESGL